MNKAPNASHSTFQSLQKIISDRFHRAMPAAVIGLGKAVLQGKLRKLEGSGRMTTPPGGNRSRDRFDFSIIQLEPDFVAALGNVRFVSDGELYVTDFNTEGHAYMALGYPSSRNKKIDHRRRTIRPQPFTYGANALRDEAFAEKLGISGNDHLFLKWDKRSRDPNGTIVNSIAPVGMSGGALIDLGRFSDPSYLAGTAPQRFRLAGLLIEVHHNDKRMVAVKIDTVLGVL